jgi:tetratricopeptide (TPR) repeat protein
MKTIIVGLLLGLCHTIAAQTPDKDSAGVYASRAHSQLALKKYDQAIENYMQALKFDPAGKGINRAIGEVYYNFKNDAASAKNYFERETEITPDDADSWLQLGYCYYAIKDFDLAANHAKKALAIWKYPSTANPSASSALNLIGNVAMAAKDTAGAKQSFLKALKVNKKEIPARKNLARINEIEEHFNEAKNLYLEITALDNGDAQAHLSLANIYFYEGASKLAALEFVTALLLKPALENSNENPIQIFQFISKNKKEAKPVQAIVDSLNDKLLNGDVNPPDAIPSYAAIGYASLYYLNNPGEAVNQFQKVIKIKPDLDRVNFYLGEAFFQMNKLPQAYDYYLKYSEHVEDGYNYAKCFLMIGKILVKQKKFEDAQLQILKSLKIYPNAESYYYYGLALRGALQLDEAVSAFEKAIKTYPQYTEALVEMGRTYWLSKKYDKAFNSYQKALLLDSNNCPAHQLLAQWYLTLDRLDEAEQEIVKAVALTKRSGNAEAPLFGEYGEILLQQKKYDQAKLQFENEFQLDSTSSFACYKLASLYGVKQNAESCVFWLEKAFQRRFTDFSKLEKDKLFNSVRMLAPFKDLVSRYQSAFHEELMNRLKQK